MIDLDLAPDDFLAFEKALKKRGVKWITSKDDSQRIRALCAGWAQEYRGQLVRELGETDEILRVDEGVQWLQSRRGVRTSADDVRTVLRQIARRIQRDLLPAYDATRWSSASVVDESDAAERPLESRLRAVEAALAESYRQALTDLGDRNRLTYVGPATELREVLGATIRKLSPPDEEIAAQPWFKGHQGSPTQAERIRAILSDKELAGPPSRTLDIIDSAIGAVARMTYRRASAATHLGREAPRAEVEKLRTWVDAVLGEILPSVE